MQVFNPTVQGNSKHRFLGMQQLSSCKNTMKIAVFIFSTSSSCGFVITVVLKEKWELSLDRDDDGDDGVKYNTKIILTKKKKKFYIFKALLDCVWNMMAHAQKPYLVFRRNGRVHLNRCGHQFRRLLEAVV